jgi:uncharacterized OB-fold protein
MESDPDMQTAKTPRRILGLYDEPFWDYMRENKEMWLQCCSRCGNYRYPPGPICHECLSPEHAWKRVSGEGELLSWIVFHKQYLPEYPAPYNVIAVKLKEGPIVISNLAEDPDRKDLIGKPVRLRFVEMDDGVTLPRFDLVE